MEGESQASFFRRGGVIVTLAIVVALAVAAVFGLVVTGSSKNAAPSSDQQAAFASAAAYKKISQLQEGAITGVPVTTQQCALDGDGPFYEIMGQVCVESLQAAQDGLMMARCLDESDPGRFRSCARQLASALHRLEKQAVRTATRGGRLLDGDRCAGLLFRTDGAREELHLFAPVYEEARRRHIDQAHFKKTFESYINQALAGGQTGAASPAELKAACLS